jgi:hypothetical protein
MNSQSFGDVPEIHTCCAVHPRSQRMAHHIAPRFEAPTHRVKLVGVPTKSAQEAWLRVLHDGWLLSWSRVAGSSTLTEGECTLRRIETLSQRNHFGYYSISDDLWVCFAFHSCDGQIPARMQFLRGESLPSSMILFQIGRTKFSSRCSDTCRQSSFIINRSKGSAYT